MDREHSSELNLILHQQVKCCSHGKHFALNQTRRLHWSQWAAPTRNQCNECPFRHTSILWETYGGFQRDCQLESSISICLADSSRTEDGRLCNQESHLERTRSCSSKKSCPYLLGDMQSHSCRQMRCWLLEVGLGRFWRGYSALFAVSFSVVLINYYSYLQLVYS